MSVPRGSGPRATAIATAVLVAACDIPTSLDTPIIRSQFLVPVEADSVTIGEVLPSGIGLVADRFTIDANAVSTSTTLAALCPGCPAGTAPKPAFEGTVNANFVNPSDVLQATLGTGASLRLSLDNRLGFDPIRPAAGVFGTIVTEIRSGSVSGPLIVADTIRGQSVAIPTGAVTQRTIALPAGAQVGTQVFAVARVTSPAGDAVFLQPAAQFIVVATPQAISATGAQVRVLHEAFSSSSASLSFDGVSRDITDRVDSARVEVVVANPLLVQGSVTIAFVQGATNVIPPKTVTLASAATQTLTVGLSGTEIRTLLAGSGIEVRLSGTVSGPTATGNVVTVTPTSTVARFESRVRLLVTLSN